MNTVLLLHIIWNYQYYMFLGVVVNKAHVYCLAMASLVQMFSGRKRASENLLLSNECKELAIQPQPITVTE